MQSFFYNNPSSFSVTSKIHFGIIVQLNSRPRLHNVIQLEDSPLLRLSLPRYPPTIHLNPSAMACVSDQRGVSESLSKLRPRAIPIPILISLDGGGVSESESAGGL
ncbi:hypothetical protein K443DRAFT_681605 [Laccaria amethystina LaAM-08-1]|uniref:Unplaced genomic scaffold K443scaffold_161, whole genome shotgun sequence n=1 Tax=Laccaria amethystina LaAM-08-1 TaxID=1095629 RepID=A0A0C9WLK5_9AGAR|nr:hypothetical protein K443DRAFT_681605 [Laccaria amethystina LaAM-08-1]